MTHDIYDYPLYRPPSEAYSLILQITLGCSHNKCTFCNMYTSKKFTIKPIDLIKKEIDFFRAQVRYARRIFLADGDALIIKTSTLLEIVDYINEKFPEKERIAIYASPRSLLLKTDEELKTLRERGIDLIYLGLESGDNDVLTFTNKGVTIEKTIEGAKKAHKAGFKISATVIAGLAGSEGNKGEIHALKTAEAISEIAPDYLGVLCLNLLPETTLKDQADRGEFKESTGPEMIEEVKLMIENIKVPEGREIVFRSNHISNFLNLQGTLPDDKEKLISEVNFALSNSDMMIGRMKRRSL